MILYRFQSKINFEGRNEKKIERNNTKVYIGWNIEFIFFAHSEKQCLQQSKNLQKFCLRSLLLPFQEENNPKIMFNAINIVYNNNSSQKNIQGKKPSIIKSKLSYHCALYSKSNPKLYSKNILNCRLELLRLRFFLQLHCIH